MKEILLIIGAILLCIIIAWFGIGIILIAVVGLLSVLSYIGIIGLVVPLIMAAVLLVIMLVKVILSRKIITTISIIFILFFIVVAIIFIFDSFFKNSDYGEPFNVGEKFVISYMLKDAENMKVWSDSSIYSRINELHYTKRINTIDATTYEEVGLITHVKLENIIVATYSTYSYGDSLFKDEPLFYTVVLQPFGSETLWEKFKEFIYYKIPLGDKFFKSLPVINERWIVMDFYSNDDFEKYYNEKIEKLSNINSWLSQQNNLKFNEEIYDKLSKYEKNWSQLEKIKQNDEIKNLYNLYINYDKNQ